MGPMPRLGGFGKNKKGLWKSPLKNKRWKNWGVPKDLINLASQQGSWLDKIKNNIKGPPMRQLQKSIVKITEKMKFTDARGEVINWLNTKKAKKVGFEDFFKTFSILIRTNPHFGSKMRKLQVKKRAGFTIKNNELPDFNQDLQELNSENNGVVEEMTAFSLNDVLAKPIFGNSVPNTTLIQRENWMFDKTSLELTEQLYDFIEAKKNANQNPEIDPIEGSGQNFDQDPSGESNEEPQAEGSSLLQNQLMENCMNDENPALCRYKKQFTGPQLEYLPIKGFDQNAPPQTLDSCLGGSCLTRGNLYQTLQPFLAATSTDRLNKDENTKLFDGVQREKFIRPFTQLPYAAVNEESLNFQNLILNAEDLFQNRMNRIENQKFRKDISWQSAFDGVIGIIFLSCLMYKLAKSIWDYFDKNWNKKSDQKRVTKKRMEANLIMKELVGLAEETLRTPEDDNY